MNMSKSIKLVIAAILTFWITGCSDGIPESANIGKVPEANDETCKNEYLAKVTNKENRQKLADACFLRGGYTKSTPQSW